MTVKDLIDVFGDIDFSIYRSVYNVETGDISSSCLHSGLASKIPESVRVLDVEFAEPNSEGLNVDVV